MTEPLLPPPPAHAVPSTRPTRAAGVPMALRHVFGVLVGLLVTPVGILLVDIGVQRWQRRVFQTFETGFNVGAAAWIVGGALALFAVAAAARVSGLAPLVGGVLYGVLPGLWIAFSFTSYQEFVLDLPNPPASLEMLTWLNAGPGLFPVVAAALLGAAVAGRWLPRRR